MMKRAQTKVVGTASFQFYKRTYNVQDIDAGENLLYGVLTDQGVKYSNWLCEK